MEADAGVEAFPGCAIQAYLDDELWSPLEHALRSAKRQIALTQLLFEPDFAPRGARLADDMEDAARRGVRVRILVNENAAIPDSVEELVERFEDTPVEVRKLTMSPNVLHAKLFAIDDEAFLVDPPFEQKYVDTRAHVHTDAVRTRGQPFHSVSVRTQGPIVARVWNLFERLWGVAQGRRIGPLAPIPGAALVPGGKTMRLAWTAPAGFLEPTPAAGILAEYEGAIARAKRFIYIEDQYFTSPRIAAALERALEREPGLEVIIVLNTSVDIPGYVRYQKERLASMGFPDHPRLGVFALWSQRIDGDLRELYVHSKVAIVDDAWATVGSANLDSIGLHDADEFPVPVERNIELNVVVPEDGGSPGFVAALRRRLWSEHLGDDDIWRAPPPGEGWLAHWRGQAARALAHAEAGERMRGHALPYGTKPQVARRKAPFVGESRS